MPYPVPQRSNHRNNFAGKQQFGLKEDMSVPKLEFNAALLSSRVAATV
jgi:hypothetical protein